MPPTVMLTAKNFELDLKLIMNVSVEPFINASLVPQLNVSMAAIESHKPDASSCAGLPLKVGINGSVAARVGYSPVLSILNGSVNGTLEDLDMPELCAAGACTSIPADCRKEVHNLHLPKLKIGITRHLKPEHMNPNLRDAVAFGLGLLPNMVEVLNGTEAEGSEEAEDSTDELVFAEKGFLKKEGAKVAQALASGFAEAEQKHDGAGHKPTAGDETLTQEGNGVAHALVDGLEAVAQVELRKALRDHDTAAHKPTARDETLTKEGNGLAHALVDGLEAAAQGELRELGTAARRPSKPLNVKPSQQKQRRLAGGGSCDSGGCDTFLVRLHATPRYELTEELLQRLVRQGAFRIRDGRERELGPIQVASMRLLKPGVGVQRQQLWARAAPVASASAPAQRQAMGALGAVAAAGVVGLAALAAAAWRQHRARGDAEAPAE